MPLRLAILGDSPCHACNAACCRQNGHAFAVLLQTQEEVRRFRPWATTARFLDRHSAVTRTESVIPYVGGKCPFLGNDDRCSIYEDRPLGCRQFQCVSRFNRHGIGQHDEFLIRNPDVLLRLESL